MRKLGIAVLLCAVTFSSCSKEDTETEFTINGGSFFKINVATENFTESNVNTRTVSATGDTIITPLDDEMYIETILEREPQTRATTLSRVAQNTEITMMVYENVNEDVQNLKYVGKLIGTVNSDGSVSMADNQLSISSGRYLFICVANGELSDDNLYFYTLKGSNSMVSKFITKIIGSNDTECVLSFKLLHKVSQIKITLASEIGDFSCVNASLTGTDFPTKQRLKLNTTDVTLTDPYENLTTLNDQIFKSISGTTATSEPQNYYNIGGGFNATAKSGLLFSFDSGSVGGTNLAGKKVTLNNFILDYNKITSAKITIKGYNTTFLAEGEGTVSLDGKQTGKSGTTFASIATGNDASSIFLGWFKNEETTPVTSDKTLSVIIGPAETNNVYKAKFRLRNLDDLPIIWATSNLLYDATTGYSFANDPRYASKAKYGPDYFMFNSLTSGSTSSPSGDPCQQMGGGWRTPTKDEWVELGTCGHQLDKTENVIYYGRTEIQQLPRLEFPLSGHIGYANNSGYRVYWSDNFYMTSEMTPNPSFHYIYNISSNNFNSSTPGYRATPVRCVRNK